MLNRNSPANQKSPAEDGFPVWMRWLGTTMLALVLLAGCTQSITTVNPGPWAPGPLRHLFQGPVKYPNPVLVPAADPNVVWERLVLIVGDYFRIRREQRPTGQGAASTPGVIETAPTVGATLLEPWRGDSVGFRNRREATLQSIRRLALVSVRPTAEGYLVEVKVFKELEEVRQPQSLSPGEATFSYADSLEGFREPVAGPEPTAGWIPLGRDPALEQRIIGRLLTE